jgi:hypothetical protein
MAIAVLAILASGSAALGQVAAPPPAGMQLDPGVTLRVYSVEGDLASIPKLVSDQTPNFDTLAPTIDFRNDSAFGKVPASFVSIVTGWVIVSKGGEHQFQLTSDDGGAAVHRRQGRHRPRRPARRHAEGQRPGDARRGDARAPTGAL